MNIVRDKVLKDDYMCSKLCAMIKRKELRNDHKQQRKSGQWSNETRDNFIVTVLLNEDFDAIKICEQITEDNGVFLWIIDGLQKSSYIAKFKDGTFKLGKNINPTTIEYQQVKVDENGIPITDKYGDPVNETVSIDLRGKGYKDLPERLKENFDNCPVHIVKHLNCTDEEIARHIVRYNSGRPMVTNQKLATYVSVTVAKCIKMVSDHPFFNDCANYSSTVDKNGSIDRIVAETIMGINFFDSWTKNIKKLAKCIDEKANEEMFNTLNSYLDRLMDVVTPETGKLFCPKNAHIWFMLFDKFTKTGLPDERFGDFLNDFDDLSNEKVEVDNEYELTAGSDDATNVISYTELDGVGNSKSASVIKDKLFIMESLMREYLHIEDSVEESTEESEPEVIENDLFDTETVEESLEKPVVDNTEIEHVDGEVVDSTTNTDIKSALNFVRKYVDESISELDVQDYEEYLNIITLNVDNSSKLLEVANHNPIIGVIAYAYQNDIDCDEWFVSYFNKTNTYNVDQIKSYLNMRNDLITFTKKSVA